MRSNFHLDSGTPFLGTKVCFYFRACCQFGSHMLKSEHNPDLKRSDSDFLSVARGDVEHFLRNRGTVKRILVFPALNSTRRYLLHNLIANEFESTGLSSFSIGNSIDRRLIIAFRSDLLRPLENIKDSGAKMSDQQEHKVRTSCRDNRSNVYVPPPARKGDSSGTTPKVLLARPNDRKHSGGSSSSKNLVESRKKVCEDSSLLFQKQSHTSSPVQKVGKRKKKRSKQHKDSVSLNMKDTEKEYGALSPSPAGLCDNDTTDNSGNAVPNTLIFTRSVLKNDFELITDTENIYGVSSPDLLQQNLSSLIIQNSHFNSGTEENSVVEYSENNDFIYSLEIHKNEDKIETALFSGLNENSVNKIDLPIPSSKSDCSAKIDDEIGLCKVDNKTSYTTPQVINNDQLTTDLLVDQQGINKMESFQYKIETVGKIKHGLSSDNLRAVQQFSENKSETVGFIKRDSSSDIDSQAVQQSLENKFETTVQIKQDSSSDNDYQALVQQSTENKFETMGQIKQDLSSDNDSQVIQQSSENKFETISQIKQDSSSDNDSQAVGQQPSENKFETMGKIKQDSSSDNDSQAVQQSSENKLSPTIPDDSDWESLYNDDGVCLKPELMPVLNEIMGPVKILKPTSSYKEFQSISERDSDGGSIVELYDVPPEFKTKDLMSVFASYVDKGLYIRWVDDTHALAVFPSSIMADEALAKEWPFVKARPLQSALPASREKARSLVLPPALRPRTHPGLARRLVTGALGLKMPVSSSDREAERKILNEAREQKRLAALQRNAAWEGTLGSKKILVCDLSTGYRIAHSVLKN